MNNLVDNLQTDTNFFADNDTITLIKTRNEQELKRKLQICLNELDDWVKDWINNKTKQVF